MKKILIPAGFSTIATKAANYAAEITPKTYGIAYLLHVIEPITGSIRQPYPLQERWQEEIAKNRQRELKGLQQTIPSYTQVLKPKRS